MVQILYSIYIALLKILLILIDFNILYYMHMCIKIQIKVCIF